MLYESVLGISLVKPSPTTGETTHMNQIFLFDDGAKIKFGVDTSDDDLCRLITANGGVVTEEFQEPNFVVAGERAAGLHLASQVIRPAWIKESILKGKMIPTHDYLDGADQNLPRGLTQKQRDLAELLQAMRWVEGDRLLDMLHRKFPYNTSNEWSGIVQTFQSVIHQVARPVAAATDDYRNTVLKIVSLHAYLLPVTPPALGDENSPNASFNEHDEDEIRFFDSRVAGVDVSAPQGAVEGVSEGPHLVLTPANSTYSSAGNGEEDEEGDTGQDGDSDYEGSGHPPSLQVPSPKQARRPSVKFTTADYDAMVQYVSELGHKPVKSDWDIFVDLNLTENSQRRNAGAWRRQYSKKRKEIQADVRRLSMSAHGASGSSS